MVCDLCNEPTTAFVGTVFSADGFRDIVHQGMGPHPNAVMHAVMTGLTQEQFVAGWKRNLVERSTSPWLLCPSCTQRAREFQLTSVR